MVQVLPPQIPILHGVLLCTWTTGTHRPSGCRGRWELCRCWPGRKGFILYPKAAWYQPCSDIPSICLPAPLPWDSQCCSWHRYLLLHAGEWLHPMELALPVVSLSGAFSIHTVELILTPMVLLPSPPHPAALQQRHTLQVQIMEGVSSLALAIIPEHCLQET